MYSIEMNTFPEQRVRQEMQLHPHRFRQDAYQDAWAAFLDGHNPASAVSNHTRDERLHEAREPVASQTSLGDQADWNGSMYAAYADDR